MIKGVKEWLQNQKNIVQKTAGMQEKEAAIKKKIEVAMAILDNRQDDLPVIFDRRKKAQA